jgi:hypothetical protein
LTRSRQARAQSCARVRSSSPATRRTTERSRADRRAAPTWPASFIGTRSKNAGTAAVMGRSGVNRPPLAPSYGRSRRRRLVGPPRWSKGDSNFPSERQLSDGRPHGSRAPLPVSESRPPEKRHPSAGSRPRHRRADAFVLWTRVRSGLAAGGKRIRTAGPSYA